ncbi:MAG TPA: pyrimidine dimer DNA glycosylase/endonuclease V [Spirochaetia bacterium]|nr:pyrimidine dimer DNA glycosylase/endonuclease V [Spirochaetales bacterium]HPD79413.1 pyrimidine dimer DNA glycosylase/endonuclease V [Spirochaetales bacterium]HQK35057.1 pyrimidine dimer DNA glycosylase/endonuclease V [Spirochaetales bacterium]HRS64550.1 pyrimidine dimer DNA glycosylase/endonuclease V [Spirochaetia bacterium]HRV28365.1 pyrimidine dimer DNA glycosylase/endonuclease V [Spirochaetia bacterium]
MRLWSLNPELLDVKGLLAVWREGLLAKHVLQGKTKGYTHHPQLIRFKNTENPLTSINSYLFYVYNDAVKRGYKFDSSKIDTKHILEHFIPVTEGQVYYEFEHLCKKLSVRDPERYKQLCLCYQFQKSAEVLIHPLFYSIPGPIEAWEKHIS